MRGGAELVALWAQLSSVIELAAGVALAGVGTGLAVYVARTKSPERQRELLREALKIGLGVALPIAALMALGASVLSGVLAGGKLAPSVLALGAAAGWLAVIPGLINGYWLGQQRREGPQHARGAEIVDRRVPLDRGRRIVFRSDAVVSV